MSIALGPDTDFQADAAARRAEARSYRAMARIVGRPVRQPPRSAMVPAVLVPGFISGTVSLTLLSRYLRRLGHRTFPSGVGANLGCTDDMVERLLRTLERTVEAEGRPVALVGHSRGGMIVKLAAARRPELVSGVVALAGPVTGVLSVAPHVRRQLEMLFRLQERGWSVLGADCVRGECAERVVAQLSAPWPPGLPYTSVYSRSDAIVDWQTCLDPAAEQIEVSAAHTGMASDATVHRIVAERLASMANQPSDSY